MAVFLLVVEFNADAVKTVLNVAEKMNFMYTFPLPR
jgi:hypothetical protein